MCESHVLLGRKQSEYIKYALEEEGLVSSIGEQSPVSPWLSCPGGHEVTCGIVRRMMGFVWGLLNSKGLKPEKAAPGACACLRFKTAPVCRGSGRLRSKSGRG